MCKPRKWWVYLGSWQQPDDATEFDSDKETRKGVELEPATNARRYPMRQRRETCWYLDKEYVMLTNASELEIFEEAMSDEQSKD